MTGILEDFLTCQLHKWNWNLYQQPQLSLQETLLDSMVGSLKKKNHVEMVERIMLTLYCTTDWAKSKLSLWMKIRYFVNHFAAYTNTAVLQNGTQCILKSKQSVGGLSSREYILYMYMYHFSYHLILKQLLGLHWRKEKFCLLFWYDSSSFMHPD